MKSIVFIDFDETLFYHYSYLRWADTFLAGRNYTKKIGDYVALVENFHTDKGEKMRLYDHVGHLKAVSHKNWSFISGELEKEIRRAELDFCYPDAHQFLRKIVAKGHDARILTYGDSEYQHYKIRTCRVLRELHIPVHIVHEPKRVFLEREFAHSQGILIDDKHPLKLPKNWQHIWIERSGTMDHKNLSKNVRKIKSLAEFRL